MKTKSFKLSGSKGFSLVELLVVIAVIAIIAAIAIPNIANITQQANRAKDQRNAQNIASVATAAVAAGYQPAAWGDAEAVVNDVIAGITVQQAGGSAMTFKVSTLSDTEQTGAESFLTVDPATGTPGTASYVPPVVNYVADASTVGQS